TSRECGLANLNHANAEGLPDVCRLPKVVGPCEAVFPRWFFNWETQKCEGFNYGGCGGNENNFKTLEECTLACGHHGFYFEAIVGKCPKPQGAGLCVENCGSNDVCGPGKKCCSNGCGHQCIKVTGGRRRRPERSRQGPISDQSPQWNQCGKADGFGEEQQSYGANPPSSLGPSMPLEAGVAGRHKTDCWVGNKEKRELGWSRESCCLHRGIAFERCPLGRVARRSPFPGHVQHFKLLSRRNSKMSSILNMTKKHEFTFIRVFRAVTW
ncbi:papilin-like, partial [Sceloporus undulatus]|uniref:papilin-like n=1 Tax=Sceloporus undulatus TaxID=8520 RepID=UPI001C4DC9BA